MRNLVYGLYVIVVSLVGVEVLSGAYFFHQNGNLIWFRTNSREEAKAAPAGQSDTRQKLFPYIGYGLRPGWKPSDNASLEQLQEATGISSKPEWWDWPANNLGFQAAHDIPFAPEDANTVIVGIFGGSVANGFGLMAADGVKKVVHGIPGYENRTVVVLNLAQGGFKQPQQIVELSYLISLGQRFDLIIDLDGFNEAYIGWENVTISKAAVSMPTALFLYGLQNHFASTESDIARQVREARARADSYSAQMKKTHLAVHYYVLEILRDRSRTAEAKTEGEISQRVEGRVYPIVVQGESGTPIPQMADEIASIWYRGSLMMKAAADTIGAAYIQMLQPNQYYGNRVFSEAEKKIAFQTPTPHPAATIVPPVFSRMLELAKGFRQRDINFIDATTAFDGISESIYFDTCCHFNQRGYDILVNDYLAKAIPAALAQREK